MASKLLPTHTLPRVSAIGSRELSARHTIPAQRFFSSFLSSSSSSFLPCASMAPRCAISIRRRGRILPNVCAADGDQATETQTVEDDAVEEEEHRIPGEEESQPPKKPAVKLGDIMGILHKRAIEASEKERSVPDLRTGDIVEIKLEVPENRRRASIYKGIVISKQNAGIHTTIRIRRIVAGIGVEIVFPVYSPNVKEIKVVKHRKVRRAKLYYLRDKLPRLSTFK